MSKVEEAFEEWWELDLWDGCNEKTMMSDGFLAGWREACKRSAEAAYQAETHLDAVDAINGIAEAIVWEPK